jgi:16S rRNA (guanine527-N7)-methyltransferase
LSWPATDEDGFGPDDVVRLTGVSRETLQKISGFLDLLDQWRTRINLIGPGEGRHLWRRHVLDSLQLLDLIRADDLQIADLGSGAGFPGILIACALADRPGVRITLVEKSVRKSEFLDAAIRALKLPARVETARIEELKGGQYDLVTARALAALPKLLGYAHHLLKPSGKALLLKGREAMAELTLSRESWTFQLSDRASISSTEGRVLAITSLSGRKP